MIVFTAFTPHSPLLTETVGKETLPKVKKTTDAMEKLSEELYASFPDTIVIISSHSYQHDEAFSINLHDEYIANLKDFGDLSTTKTFSPNLPLIDAIQRSVRRQDIPLTLDSDSSLDHGASIPLLLLTKKLKNVKIIPVSYSPGLDAKAHAAFGRALKDLLSNASERVAVIASGDLSHCLTTDAPVGFHKEGAIFDEAIQESIRQMSSSKLISMKEEDVEAAAECAYRPMLILFGLIERMQVKPEILSYEAPFGVGFLVAQFHFS